jgi:hypothetical protein
VLIICNFRFISEFCFPIPCQTFHIHA